MGAAASRGGRARHTVKSPSGRAGDRGRDRMVPSAPPVTGTAAAPTTPTTRYAALSIAAALATIGLKTFPWWLTGSVGLLADALESLVNLGAAVMTLAMLVVAARPPDEEHAFGYGKAEYFASGVEGTLILAAAVAIAVAAVQRLAAPYTPTEIGSGLLVTVTVVASLEADIRRAVANATVLTHLEPVGDPASYLDADLDRGAQG